MKKTKFSRTLKESMSFLWLVVPMVIIGIIASAFGGTIENACRKLAGETITSEISMVYLKHDSKIIRVDLAIINDTYQWHPYSYRDLHVNTFTAARVTNDPDYIAVKKGFELPDSTAIYTYDGKNIQQISSVYVVARYADLRIQYFFVQYGCWFAKDVTLDDIRKEYADFIEFPSNRGIYTLEK